MLPKNSKTARILKEPHAAMGEIQATMYVQK